MLLENSRSSVFVVKVKVGKIKMQYLKCSHCDRGYIVSRAIEFREINLKNMSLASSQKSIERECMDCGHIDIVDQGSLATV
jgi:hypothetical protein